MYNNAYAVLLLTCLLWACNTIAGKLAVGEISPMLLTTMRVAMALLFMLAMGWRQLRRDWPVIRNHVVLLCALGAVGFTAFHATIYSALVFTTAINVSIEQAGIPMFIFMLNFLLYRVGVSRNQILGFTVTVFGVVLTAAHGDLASLAQLEINFGDALMLLGIIIYAGYTVALRHKPTVHWQSLMQVMFVGAFFSSLPFAAWELATDRMILPGALGWAIAVFSACSSVVTQVFYIRGVELIGANRAGVFVNLTPIFAMLLSIVLLGEDFHLYHVVALVMVLGGIWLAERRTREIDGRNRPS